ncbi:cytochrome D1 domain-containing protein [Devosia psychrophila]|uniref:YVTN family beta-propeller repeat protein n=1 Tax=Devosia psychrophila TaxID=728005 RepID=UPI001AEBAE06|nr:cytochrome D1 domain-containing protein [Devosia psychrophila]
MESPIMSRLKLRSLLRMMLLVGSSIGAFWTPASARQRPAALATASGFVFTANEFGNSISRIDLTTGTVETVPVSISAHNVQVTADGQFLLAVGATAGGDHEEMAVGGQSDIDMDAAGLLLIFKTASFSTGPIATIEVGAHPAHVVVDLTGKFAFVTNSGDNNVTVVDLANDVVTAVIPTGAYPHGQRMSPDGKELYVANVEDGSVSVLDPVGLRELQRIPVGAVPVQVGFTPDGSRVYVSLRDEDKVAVIDPATREILATVDVGKGPIQVHSAPDGRFVYVANQGTDKDPSETVSVVEVATNTNVATVRTGPGAHGVAVSADGTLVFITNIFDGTVSVIDAKTNMVVANFAVGEGPNGITFLPARP